jgi:hypothetical protein
MRAYSSRTDTPIFTKLSILIPYDQEEVLEGRDSGKGVLSSSPGEGCSYSSEIKHDSRTAPRPKLSVSKRRLQKLRPELRKPVLCSSPGEHVSCSSETKRYRRNASEPKFFCVGEKITGTKVTNPRSVLVSSPCEDIGFRDNFFL